MNLKAQKEGRPARRWARRVVAGELSEALDDLLADDVVFYSPIVYTPPRGKAVTTMYLHYTKQVLVSDVAMVEFETTVGCKSFDGIDIIRGDEVGRIVEFRVMIRPLQAIHAVHKQTRDARIDAAATAPG